jgi:hypothetical protein
VEELNQEEGGELTMLAPSSSNDLRAAIEQLRPNLQELVGVNYSAFEAELDALLQEKSIKRLLDLFDRHPTARDRLKETYLQLKIRRFAELVVAASGSNQLFGDPIYQRLDKMHTYYYCTLGQHEVDAKDVSAYDDELNGLCPMHGKGMAFKGSRLEEK